MSLSAPLGPPLGPPVGGPLRRQPVPYEASYPAGVHNWVSPASAYYRFVLWGGGGVDGTNGGSGALAIAVRRVARGQIVALNVADGGAPSDDTTATFPDGRVITAGSAVNTVAGVASGGDVNINGVAGGGSEAPGPSYEGYSGGIVGASIGARTPGAGGAGGLGAGAGLVLIMQQATSRLAF
jgi:hypothetical protein